MGTYSEHNYSSRRPARCNSDAPAIEAKRIFDMWFLSVIIALVAWAIFSRAKSCGLAAASAASAAKSDSSGATDVGRYRFARLTAKFVPDAEVDDVVARLSGNCPSREERRNRYDNPKCAAYLPDLENRPPPDAPPRPRQRLRVIKADG
jgi:hypothetical protein